MKMIGRERAHITDDFEVWVYSYDDGSLWLQEGEIKSLLLCSPDARLVRASIDFDDITKRWAKRGGGELTLISAEDLSHLMDLIFVEDATVSDLKISVGQEMMQ